MSKDKKTMRQKSKLLLNECSGSTKDNPHRKHASPMLGCMVLEGKIIQVIL
jgi:hypothetical protein